MAYIEFEYRTPHLMWLISLFDVDRLLTPPPSFLGGVARTLWLIAYLVCSPSGFVECEPPNNRLSKFVGTMTWSDEQFSIDNEKIVLRVSSM